MLFHFQAVGFDVSKYLNVAKWYARAQKTMVGYKEINDEGTTQLKQFLKEFQKWNTHRKYAEVLVAVT